MKKTILHRSIFTVVACIALAASVLLTAVHITPVHLAEDVKDMVGEEAEPSFCAFFEGVQTWYQEIPVRADGVTIRSDGNYAPLLEAVNALAPYIAACESKAMSDADSVDRLVDYNTPLTSLLVVILNLHMVLGSEGSYTFPADEWAAMGQLLDEVVAAYQA